MSFPRRIPTRRRLSQPLFAICIALLSINPVAAQQRVDVAVVFDGQNSRAAGNQQENVDELLALTNSEFDVRIRDFYGEWSKRSINAAIDAAYADADVDLVLISGFIANQLATARSVYPKPTFLPTLLHLGLLSKQEEDGKSGIRNLNYLSVYANFADDLDALARVSPYTKLGLIYDEQLAASIPQLRQDSFQSAAEKGIELLEVEHDGVHHDLASKIPAGTEAVLVAGLPRMPDAEFEKLIDAINEMGLPSYSFVGVPDVERGLLMTDFEPRDPARFARLNALNMQAVMLGGRAEDQPVFSEQRRQLTINMATARKINLSPPFDVISEAILLNQDVVVGGAQFGLVEIANEAIAQNQDLLAEQYRVQAGAEEIGRARSSLLPQLNAGAGYTSRNVSPSVEAGLFPERTADAALNLDQLIYADSATANLTIQKELQLGRTESLREFRLDVIQNATTTYYTVLNARSQLKVAENNLTVSRANLELAIDRVSLGTSTPSDVYRWDAEVARAQVLVLDARSFLDRSWTTLNRLLHRSQRERFALREAKLGDPFVLSTKEFESLVGNPSDFDRYSDFLIARGMQLSPELQQVDAQIAAKQREVVSQKRAFWLPDFSIGGRYASNIDQAGAGAGEFAGEGLNDWSFGVQATLPLFSGGLRRANLNQANYEALQLESIRSSSSERIEEEIRIQLTNAQAAYRQIGLTGRAAESTRKNLELVSDAYARGSLSIIELLDAQDSSLTASAASVDSIYSFLITVMALQRSVGGYDYLLAPDERNTLANELRDYLSRSNSR